MIFLDLDGTLTDPKPGITSSIIGALKKVGLDAPSADELEWAIGPPLLDSFQKLGAPDPEIALGHYRDIYTSGALYQADVYSGVIDALKALTASGHQLVLMTAKPHAYARKITAHFGFSEYLFAEYGPELDGTFNDKAELLAHALKELGADPANCVMVGDRSHDAKAALANEMAFIAAAWGYGRENEWPNADAICALPHDLPKTVENVLDRV